MSDDRPDWMREADAAVRNVPRDPHSGQGLNMKMRAKVPGPPHRRYAATKPAKVMHAIKTGHLERSGE